jgi:hypothetical protein
MIAGFKLEARDYLEIVTFVFLAGGAYAAINYRLKAIESAIRVNVNGIGGKTNKIVLYLTETAPDDHKRERLTDLFK